jgi:uncharacterized membrane protein
MEKLKIVIILLGLIWFSGCGYIKQTNIESKDIAFSEEETTSIQSDYENYIGTWSEEGKSHESIIYEGGTEFSVEITSDNELNGYLYSQPENHINPNNIITIFNFSIINKFLLYIVYH